MSDEKQTPEAEITYRHLRLPWVSHSAAITAAILGGPVGKVRVAIACCSPKEAAFCKRVGRGIAATRLLNGGKKTRYVELDKKEDEKLYDLVFRSLAVFYDHDWFPRWLRNELSTESGACLVEKLNSQWNGYTDARNALKQTAKQLSKLTGVKFPDA